MSTSDSELLHLPPVAYHSPDDQVACANVGVGPVQRLKRGVSLMFLKRVAVDKQPDQLLCRHVIKCVLLRIKRAV